MSLNNLFATSFSVWILRIMINNLPLNWSLSVYKQFSKDVIKRMLLNHLTTEVQNKLFLLFLFFIFAIKMNECTSVVYLYMVICSKINIQRKTGCSLVGFFLEKQMKCNLWVILVFAVKPLMNSSPGRAQNS